MSWFSSQPPPPAADADVGSSSRVQSAIQSHPEMLPPSSSPAAAAAAAAAAGGVASSSSSVPPESVSVSAASASASSVEPRPYCDTMPPPSVNPHKPGVRSSSAANPRSKYAVLPGFGLSDWTKLKRVAQDLAQRKGAPLRDVSAAELGTHSKRHDAWISLRGAVYNISAYVPYHPGGAVIFEGLYGKDVTMEFDKYHRWINVEGLIGPLRIGTLVAGKDDDEEEEEEEEGGTGRDGGGDVGTAEK